MISVDGEFAAVLAAAAISVPSPAERPDPCFLVTPSVHAASSVLSAPSICAAPAVDGLSTIASATPFWNVGGVGKVSPVNTRPAPAIISKVEFDCVIGHVLAPRKTKVIGYSVFINRSAVTFQHSTPKEEDRRQNSADRMSAGPISVRLSALTLSQRKTKHKLPSRKRDIGKARKRTCVSI